ncbi:sensor histidine kinase [Roseateles sp. GG27B]
MESLSNAHPSARRMPGLGLGLLLASVIGIGIGIGITLLAWAAQRLALPLAIESAAMLLMLTVLGTALTLLLVGAVGWHVGVRLTRQRYTETLRDTRMQLKIMSQLQTDWQWASNAKHHLVIWQAPQVAIVTQWENTATTEALWDASASKKVQSMVLANNWPRSQPCWSRWFNRLQQEALTVGPCAASLAGMPVGISLATTERRAACLLLWLLLLLLLIRQRPDHCRAVALTGGDHESFSYTVSHDLRAPLRVVDGFARILKEDYGRLLDRIGNDHLDRVLGAAARMNSMIDALLSLSQLSAPPLARQPVNLSPMAGFVMEELSRSAPERLLDLHIQPSLVVQGDPTLLRMLLENLLGNAWKYSSKCPRTQIRFEADQEAGQGAEHGGGQWVYRVCDNGAGFDMRFAERLFGVFQRLHSASDFQGTGVGLASVRRIVRRHGGEIWAVAEVGAGASFYFTLPGCASRSAASIRRKA